MELPEMALVCGPNGSGKSTLTYTAIIKKTENVPFIDPDRVMKERQCSSIEAGRIVSKKIEEYIIRKQSFLRESTLSSNFDLKIIGEAKEKGFKISLAYICLENVNYNIDRVAYRFAHGGHTLPTEDIIRRYYRSLKNLPEAIKRVDEAIIFDNGDVGYREVAQFKNGQLVSHSFTPKWFEATLTTLGLKNACAKEMSTEIS
jgi:predicted ABC-type ATPase